MTTSTSGRGTLLGGRYRLDDLLSEHDGARFWKGTDTVLARSVAINTVPADDLRSERLLEAARRSATVVDARLLRTLDCDEGEEVTWVVNEWAAGVSLDVLLQHDVLPPARAAWLVREVAQSIASAHRHGVAHGRLTPESVLVTEAGAVKLIGFAVSSATGSHPSELEPGSQEELAADVVNLAGILYAALVGRWPGVSPSAVPAAPRDARGPLRPRQVRAGVPRMLDALCERVLRSDPHDHAHEHAQPIRTAGEVAAALADFVDDTDATPPDMSSLHLEPTIAIRKEQLQHLLEETRPAEPLPRDAAREQAPPLPPFEEPPERPLFASTERRPVRPGQQAGAGTSDSTGSGSTGSGYWLFSEEPPTAPTGKEGRTWLRLAVILAVVVVLFGAMAVAFKMGRGDPAPERPADSTQPSKSSSPTGTPLQFASVHDFDPEGDPPSENPEQVPLATDGKTSTGWTTLTYRGNPHLGGLKSGVGLLLDLGAERTVTTAEVALRGTPTSVSLYAAPAGVNDPPTDITELDRVDARVAQQPDVTFRPDKALHTRYLVVWLTSLPPANGGYRGEITEITVRS